MLDLRNLWILLDKKSWRSFRRADGGGHCGHQVESHSILMPFPEVSCLAFQKLSPTESSEEPGKKTDWSSKEPEGFSPPQRESPSNLELAAVL